MNCSNTLLIIYLTTLCLSESVRIQGVPKKAALIAVQEPMLKEILGHPEAQACDKGGSGRDLPVRFNNVTRWTDSGVILMFL